MNNIKCLGSKTANQYCDKVFTAADNGKEFAGYETITKEALESAVFLQNVNVQPHDCSNCTYDLNPH
jgi:hypothetical protein